MTVYLDQRKQKLMNFYRDEVDTDDRVSSKFIPDIIDKKLKQVNEQITEDDIFFMFLLKISKRIEISI